MALINCPDCGHQVSDSATACPSCARPITAAPDHIQTIERTSRRYRNGMGVGFLIAVLGAWLGIEIGAEGLSGFLAFVGFGIFVAYFVAYVHLWMRNG
jgi:hypothetical protein